MYQSTVQSVEARKTVKQVKDEASVNFKTFKMIIKHAAISAAVAQIKTGVRIPASDFSSLHIEHSFMHADQFIKYFVLYCEFRMAVEFNEKIKNIKIPDAFSENVDTYIKIVADYIASIKDKEKDITDADIKIIKMACWASWARKVHNAEELHKNLLELDVVTRSILSVDIEATKLLSVSVTSPITMVHLRKIPMDKAHLINILCTRFSSNIAVAVEPKTYQSAAGIA